MPIKIYRGDSVPVAQVTKITPALVVIGDVFTITCNGKSISYTAAAATATDVVNGLTAALTANAAGIPEFTEFTAAAVLAAMPGPSDGSYVTLTAATPGVPFVVTATSSVTLAGSVTVTETTKGSPAVNEVHQISLVGTYTGGTFTITYSFGTTAAIAYNATAAAVQTALAALAGVGVGQVLVTGGPGPGSPWFVQWTGTLAGTAVAVGTINGASLTGNGSVTIAETTLGNGLSDSIQQLDCHLSGATINFTLSLSGQTTSTITKGSTAAQVQTALQGLANVGNGNVLVYDDLTSGGAAHDFFIIHFTGALAGTNVAQLVVGGWADGTAAPTVNNLQTGGQTSSDDFQLIQLGAAATGNFTVTYSGQTTTAVNTFAGGVSGGTAINLQAALQALSTIGANNVTVYDNSIWGPQGQETSFLVHFTGAKANTRMQSLTVNTGALSGAALAITRISVGQANTNEVQQVTVFGTGGTFTLTLAGQTTAATAWNAAAATLQANIIAAFTNSITAATVSGAGTLASPYVVTFTTPGNKAYALMTGSGALLTGGGGTITELTHASAGINEVQTVTLLAGVTGGTFTLAFNGAVTGNIAFNASAATVQTALTGLATVNTLTVSGSAGGPYTVTWSGAQAAQQQNLLVGNGSNLTGAPGTQTITVATLTFSSGPNHYNDGTNWSPLGVPNTLDAVYFEQGSADCKFGLNEISTFTWSTGPNQGTWALADLVNGQTVFVSTTNTLPAGLAAGTTYFLINVNRDAGTFQLSLTLGGAAVVVSTTGTGVHTVGARLASLEVNSRWTGNLGLSQQNALGYFEYRPLYLHIGMATIAQTGLETVTIGTGNGSGPGGTCQIDTDVDAALIKVINTGGANQPGLPAMLWKGQNGNSTLNLVAGSMGIALFPNETALLASLAMRSGTLELGAGVTITGPIDKTGGTLLIDSSAINGNVLLR